MFNAVKTSCLLVCFFVGQITSVHSQEVAALQLSETDFFTDFPVVLTATRLKQPQKNSPIATTIIDREMIEASGFTEIADLMRLAPGVLVNYDGNVPAVGYGFLYHRYTVRLQVLVDGRSVYTPIFGELPWTQLGITIDDIERIEVIRGPSSSSYGANAMTGVISIITRHTSLDRGAKVKVNIGKNGLREQFVRIAESAGNFNYRISVASRKNEGFKDRDDDLDISLVNFRSDYQVTNKDNLTFLVTYNKGLFDEDNGKLHDREILNSEQHIKWNHTFNSNNDFILQYYQQKRVDNNNYTSDPILPPFPFTVFVNNNVTSKRKNLEFSHTLHADNYSFSWGAAVREDTTIAPQYLYQASVDTVDTKQVYANAEFKLNKNNIINAGILVDESDTAGKTTSPRIAFNHHIDKNQTIRISHAKATRSPFIFEEYTNWFIPELEALIPGSGSQAIDFADIEAENITAHEIGYLALLNNKKTEIDLRYYEYTMSDLIYIEERPAQLIAAGGVYFDNLDKASASGFEASVTQKYKNGRIRLNYAHTNIVGETMISFDEYETGAPKDNISIIAMHDFSDTLSGSLSYYYTSAFKQLTSSEQQDARRRIDIRLAKEFKFDQSKAKLAVVIQNITDEEIETDLNNNIDRGGYVSFSMEF